MIPKRSRGRQSEAAQLRFQDELDTFIGQMLQISEQVGFKMSGRGWCYALEPYGLNKGEFGPAQKLINDCRKSGLLPNGFIADDEARRFYGGEGYIDSTTPEEEARDIVGRTASAHQHYNPISFWESQDYYVQMLVEKIDLRTLFQPICDTYSIPIATTKGWSAIRQRKELIGRFKEHESEGRAPVLLYCGDFDPKGLQISDFLKSNLDELYGATHWKSTNLVVDRFGLNYDFIEANNLTWIENLETGSGDDLANPRHRDHHQDYVQDYLSEYGARKVEANAIVVAPDTGRALCEETINRYIDPGDVDDHAATTQDLQVEVRDHVRKLMAREGNDDE